jgi:CDP-glycerol glycerophosphotransferase (TagB/SpsB family)
VRQVFIGHGESDKGASAHKLYRSYDKFCIPGQAGIDRFIERGIEVRDDFFVTIGRPQLENLVTASDQGKTSSEIQKVLYAPTWFGSSADDHHSSISRGAEIVKAIIDKGWTVIFRPHPLSLIDVPLTIEADDRRYVREIDQIIEEAVSRTGKPHLGSKQSSIMDVYECMNFSDALVTDVSSMIVDYLITDKPIAVNSNYRTLEEFYDAKPNMRDLYSIDKSLSNLSDSLDLLKSDPKVGERVRQKVYYLGAAKPSAQVQYFLSKIELLLR